MVDVSVSSRHHRLLDPDVDSDVFIVRISVTSDTSIVRPSVKVVSHPGLWGIVSLPCLQFIYVRNDWAAVFSFLDQVVNWGKFFYDKVRGILSFPLLLLALEPIKPTVLSEISGVARECRTGVSFVVQLHPDAHGPGHRPA